MSRYEAPNLIEQIKEEKERHESLMQELKLKIENNYRHEKVTVKVCETCKWCDRKEEQCRKFDNEETTPKTMLCDDWEYSLCFGSAGDPPNFRSTDQNCCITCSHNKEHGEHGYCECEIMKCEPELMDLYICDRYQRNGE